MLFTLGHINLGGARGHPDRPNAGPRPRIRADQAPASSPLFAGQLVQEMANFAVVTTASNYATNVPGASIDTVEVSALGDAVDLTTPLLAGQSAGYRVTVRDTAGTEQIFATGLVTVAQPPPLWAYTPVEQGVQITSWPDPGTAALSILEVTENRALLGL